MNAPEPARSHRTRHRDARVGGLGRRWRTALVVTALLLSYAAVDIFLPLRRDLTQFDPVAVGGLETKMWRSYYERQRVALFLELAQTLRTQYRFPLLRSYVGAYYGASAAFVFKEGRERSDYEKALPTLRTYFGMIRNTGSIDFDVGRATTLELEWWIVHREHERYPSDALEHACAEAAAALYRVPAASTLEHGRLRAQAMLLRDARAEAGGVTEPEWTTIELLLQQSYRALRAAVASASGTSGNIDSGKEP
ncbi:hypothetical protein [Cupriavidus sp. TMH.W2]|uniref:hypothetical protein n=1 Tax=Cupriavidus sp. TMH.W2 TaxID=3434465 RepID=UPI003D7794AF